MIAEKNQGKNCNRKKKSIKQEEREKEMNKNLYIKLLFCIIVQRIRKKRRFSANILLNIVNKHYSVLSYINIYVTVVGLYLLPKPNC